MQFEMSEVPLYTRCWCPPPLAHSTSWLMVRGDRERVCVRVRKREREGERARERASTVPRPRTDLVCRPNRFPVPRGQRGTALFYRRGHAWCGRPQEAGRAPFSKFKTFTTDSNV